MFRKQTKVKSNEALRAVVFTGTATPEEKEQYRQLKAREARESQAAWSNMKGWWEL